MTPIESLTDRTLSNLDQPRVSFDPLTLAILLAVVGAVIQHYVERCLDRLDHKTLTVPSLMQRGNLWLNCLWAAHREGGTKEHAAMAYAALLKTGATVTPLELARLKSS